MIKPVVDAAEASAAVIKGVSGPNFAQDALTVGDSPGQEIREVDAGRSLDDCSLRSENYGLRVLGL